MKMAGKKGWHGVQGSRQVRKLQSPEVVSGMSGGRGAGLRGVEDGRGSVAVVWWGGGEAGGGGREGTGCGGAAEAEWRNGNWLLGEENGCWL